MVGPGAAVIRVWRSSGAGPFCVRNIRFRHAFLGHDHESSVSPVSSQVCAQKPGTDDRSRNGCRSRPEGGQARSAERRTARTYGRRSCSQVRAKEEIERAASIVDAAGLWRRLCRQRQAALRPAPAISAQLSAQRRQVSAQSTIVSSSASFEQSSAHAMQMSAQMRHVIRCIGEPRNIKSALTMQI